MLAAVTRRLLSSVSYANVFHQIFSCSASHLLAWLSYDKPCCYSQSPTPILLLLLPTHTPPPNPLHATPWPDFKKKLEGREGRLLIRIYVRLGPAVSKFLAWFCHTIVFMLKLEASAISRFPNCDPQNSRLLLYWDLSLDMMMFERILVRLILVAQTAWATPRYRKLKISMYGLYSCLTGSFLWHWRGGTGCQYRTHHSDHSRIASTSELLMFHSGQWFCLTVFRLAISFTSSIYITPTGNFPRKIHYNLQYIFIEIKMNESASLRAVHCSKTVYFT